MREIAIAHGIGKKSYDKRLKHIEVQSWETIQYTYKFYHDLWNGAYADLCGVLNEVPKAARDYYKLIGVNCMPEQRAIEQAIRNFVRSYREYKL